MRQDPVDQAGSGRLWASFVFAGSLGMLLPACGNTGTGQNGSPPTGGSAQGGGTATTAGGAGAGGTTGTSQLPGLGGVTGSGGVTASAGTTSTGGRAGTGGAAGSGGVTSTGSPTSSGGVTRTGGVTGIGGASAGSGGVTGPGGAAAGTTGMRGLTPQQIVKEMHLGWNLGNTFDASPNETSWGNPQTTQAMIQAVAKAGFKTMRIPVTWTDHIGAAPNYTIASAWMDMVEQVVKWTLDAGMYAIVNTHHDADLQWILLTAAAQPQVTAEVTAVWTQIATRFKSYSDYLIYECFNEPHGSVNSFSGGNAEQQTALNAYLVACVTVIRGSGGNNGSRQIMIQPHGASPVQTGIQAMLKASIINDPNLIISLHTYYPTGFSMNASPNTWGTTAADYTAMSASLDQILGWLPNRAIVIGEWGSISKNDLTSRERHAKAYAQDVTKRSMCPIWWDNGGSDFGLLNRKANPPSWTFQTVVTNLVAGATAGAAPGAVEATLP